MPELNQRQKDILMRVHAEGEVGVDTLAGRFGVTAQQIRRDLAVLCDQGMAMRTHGGVRRPVSVANIEYDARRNLSMQAKQAIAAAAAGLIEDNTAVAINIGTTTEAVANALFNHDNLMVLTNNLNILQLMARAPGKQLVLVGGTVRAQDGAVVGGAAVEFIERYKVDYAVIGASALDDDGAILDFDSREVDVARAILRNARKKILVCDAGKFLRRAPVRICGIDEIDVMVTDRQPPPQFVAAAGAAGTRIVVAATKGSD